MGVVLCTVCSLSSADLIKTRLVGNSSTTGGQYSGRLEVFYNGSWGTVCDHSWGFQDTIVACKEMGFPSAEEYYSPGNDSSLVNGETTLTTDIFTFVLFGWGERGGLFGGNSSLFPTFFAILSLMIPFPRDTSTISLFQGIVVWCT